MSRLKRYLADSIIAHEGELAKKLFVLIEGKIGIFRGETKITEFDKEGTIVGEMSLILKEPRTATIKAITNVSVLEVEGELDEIVKQYPNISKKIIKSLAERLAALTKESFH
jgi:CRP-like cAMP-binding protein